MSKTQLQVALNPDKGGKATIVMATPVATTERTINRQLFDSNKEYREEIFELMYIEVREKELSEANN